MISAAEIARATQTSVRLSAYIPIRFMTAAVNDIEQDI